MADQFRRRQGAGHHDGGNRDGTHGERPAGAEEGVDHRGQQACIKAGFGFQSGQQPESDPLGNQDDGCDDAGQQVAAEIAAVIAPAPVQYGQEPSQIVMLEEVFLHDGVPLELECSQRRELPEVRMRAGRKRKCPAPRKDRKVGHYVLSQAVRG